MDSIRSVSDAIKIIDDVITREIEWADEPTDDIQKAWHIIKNNTR
tara:strand:+ start:863 stop:997 length:135 start_codon:yes stop_codon:yes gene_type:complete